MGLSLILLGGSLIGSFADYFVDFCAGMARGWICVLVWPALGFVCWHGSRLALCAGMAWLESCVGSCIDSSQNLFLRLSLICSLGHSVNRSLIHSLILLFEFVVHLFVDSFVELLVGSFVDYFAGFVGVNR